MVSFYVGFDFTIIDMHSLFIFNNCVEFKMKMLSDVIGVCVKNIYQILISIFAL